MSPERWREVEEVYNSAMEREATLRGPYLAEACSDDEDLRREVESLLAQTNGTALVDHPALQVVADLLDTSTSQRLYPDASYEHPFEPGELLDGRFRIVREIAQGGMGVVYEAVDEKLQRRIALKCAKTGFRKRLPPEVRNATEISHSNVCKIFEIHTASTRQGEIDFITMEFLDGETLADRIARGPLPGKEARGIALQLCAGLAEAHRNQVIHGDLKCNNIILTTGPHGAIRAVITDFGSARRPQTAEATAPSGPLAGTPDYMAPELWKGGKPSVLSDIYALGVILSQLGSGWPQNRIITRCRNEDPARRFRNADDVARMLVPPHSRRWFLAAAVAAVLAVATGVVTYQRAKALPDTVRLAILPFETDADAAAMSEGLLFDTSDRLSHVKAGRTRRLSLIPVAVTLQNKIDQPLKARTMLGASHVLHGTLRKQAGRVIVVAYLTDTSSLLRLSEWQGEYSMAELRNVPVAMAGMVTGTLKLPPLAIAATVNAAAYPDYAAGVALARRDPAVDRALPLLERAVTADPNSPLTHARLAEAQWVKYTRTKDPQWQERALASLKNAEQLNPDVAAVRLLSGMIHESFRQYELAKVDLLRAVELEPNNDDAWRRLGNIYEGSNQPNEALRAYRKAIEVQPDYFKNYEQLGYFFFREGEYEEAVQQRKRVVELVPDLADAHYQLAAPYLNLGRYPDAEYELNIAISYKETANAVEGLGLLRHYQGRDLEAIPYFRRAIEIGPPTSLYYINLGTAQRRANFQREAEQSYRKGLDLEEGALAQHPEDGYEKACLAYLCARLGDLRRAESEAAQALQLSAGALSVRWMIALTYEALGQHDRTLGIIQDAPASMLDRLNRYPDLADLRADSRFQQLLVFRHIQ
jgi:serine/threonine protein kinase